MPPHDTCPRIDRRTILAGLALAAPAVGAGPHPAAAEARLHGIAMQGEPALPAGFSHLAYVRPGAPKGGSLTLGIQGSFNSLNPFSYRGISASGLWGYVYESLMARADDEAFTLYGLIAETVEVPPDRRSITFHLRPEARFSDGHPITTDDVIFSHALLKEKSWPFLRSDYNKVSAVEKLSERTVRFSFAVAGDREIPLILGLMRVLPRHRVDPEAFERTNLDIPVGSGPYLVDRVDAGRSIIYRRDPNWWARDLAITRGRFNFNEVRYEYYRDAHTLFEAFSSGAVDLRVEDDPGRWAEGYDIPAVTSGQIVKREIDTGLPAGMWGLALNTRRPPFADVRVRQALILLFDAEWMNRNLYHGLYRRTESYFERSYLSAHGRPASQAELALLQPFAGAVKPEVLDGTFRQPVSDGSGRNRENREKAYRMLADAGFVLKDRLLVHGATGRRFEFEFLAQMRGQERMLGNYAGTLESLGIRMVIRLVDTAQYWARVKAHDYDMVQATWRSSLSPGNEQINRWGSRAADLPNTLNFPGVKNPAADAMIEALLAAATREEFIAAVRALDRVLISGDYVIPLFYMPKVWIAYARRLKWPSKAPTSGFDVDTWWTETEP